MTVLVVNADGACSGNPGPGGYGAWWEHDGYRVEHFGGEPSTTNNRMELQAAIEALRAIARMPSVPDTIVLRSDSQYVVRGMNEWMAGWKRRRWNQVKNSDAWQQLDASREGLNVIFEWVRGHNGDPGNEHADLLARRGLAESRRLGKPVALVDTAPLSVAAGVRP